uniref:Ig-like domain-containing protein n=1 Tax=Labrus bergylta TaxID=56723 RepID=A0A3Q3FP49_9LABR
LNLNPFFHQSTIHLLFSVLFSECKGEDRVIQPTEDVFASEGDTVTLGCTFETTDPYPNLFWYRQKVGDFPKYILRCYSKDINKAPEFRTDKFNAAINGTSVPLKIQKLQLTDSAVYYCALRPTVTGNTTTLYKNLWREDNTILHNIHWRESHTDRTLVVYVDTV